MFLTTMDHAFSMLGMNSVGMHNECNPLDSDTWMKCVGIVHISVVHTQ